MAIAELHTKKKIVDVKANDDVFDKEYMRRLENTKTAGQLSDLLRDYEEFLPEGLQRFRDAPRRARKELLFQKDRFLAAAKKGQMLQEPTEAAILFSPPMISMPRTMAVNFTQEAHSKGKTHVRITWGQAFLRLSGEGMIEKLIRTQERMYKKIIDLKQYVDEQLDTTWNPEDNKK